MVKTGAARVSVSRTSRCFSTAVNRAFQLVKPPCSPPCWDDDGQGQWWADKIIGQTIPRHRASPGSCSIPSARAQQTSDEASINLRAIMAMELSFALPCINSWPSFHGAPRACRWSLTLLRAEFRARKATLAQQKQWTMGWNHLSAALHRAGRNGECWLVLHSLEAIFRGSAGVCIGAGAENKGNFWGSGHLKNFSDISPASSLQPPASDSPRPATTASTPPADCW